VPSRGPPRLGPRAIDGHRTKRQAALSVRPVDEVDRVEGDVVGPVGDGDLTPATRTQGPSKLRHRIAGAGWVPNMTASEEIVRGHAMVAGIRTPVASTLEDTSGGTDTIHGRDRAA
jgi:hypothetical protein